MKKRNVIAFLLCGLLAAGTVTGCGSKDQKLEEDPNSVPKDPYEINWYFQGETLPDVASVEAAVDDYLKDKLNATVKINRLESSQYAKKLSTMIAAGEYFDACFCADWLLDYRNNANSGAWFSLDDYYKTYLPKTSEQLGDDILDNARVNGKLYAVPALKEFSEERGWAYRKDIAEKYDIDMSKIKSLEELKPVLLKIKENEPDLQYPIDWGTDRTPVGLIPYFQLTTQLALFYDEAAYGSKIVNLVETQEFEDACATAHDFYESGLIKKDVMSATDFSQRLKDGKVFAYIEFLKPGKAQEVARNFSFELGQTAVTPNIQFNNAGTGSMMAISQSSKNPVRTMRFLELVNTDKYLNNLINYGIEGKHYTKISDNMIEVAPNAAYTLQGSQWMTGNVFLNYLTKGEDPEKMQQLADFNKNAEKPWFYGFQFNTEPVQTELAACETVGKEYRPQCTLGAMDPGPAITEYRSKLKAAGVDKVIAEAQKQLDEFMAAKK